MNPGALQKSPPKLLFVVPPFQSATHPALGVSLLKSVLKEAGVDSEVLYLNLEFLKIIGVDAYKWLSLATTDVLAGEYSFAHGLFDRNDNDLAAYVLDCVTGSQAEQWLKSIRPGLTPLDALRASTLEAAAFSTRCAAEILSRNPSAIGFTSSFQQTCASAAIAKEIKRRSPLVPTILGGANCTSVMGEELLLRFPQFDFICQGEAEGLLPALILSLLETGKVPALPGILQRNGRPPASAYPALNAVELDALPPPDFFDYFEQFHKLKLDKHIDPGLVMESSRGCWWGAKQHCTFCGYNAEAMAFRRKSPESTHQQMRLLSSRHSLPRIAFADNIIPADYFRSLLPLLEAEPAGEIFYEMKSNAAKEQVEALARSGVRWVQPGIESLGDKTLRLMRKGCTAVQNTALLKWCSQNGIYVSWNHLYGFPGEDDAELESIISMIPSLHHLQPPSRAIVVEIDRFSPYFDSAEDYSLAPLSPLPAYGRVFPFPPDSLARLAFRFSSRFTEEKAASPQFKRLSKAVEDWQRAYPLSHLASFPEKESVLLLDTRPCAKHFRRKIKGLELKILRLCDRERSLQALIDACPEESCLRVEAALNSLGAERILLRTADRFLSLTVEAGPRYRRLGRIQPSGSFKNPAGETPASESGIDALIARKKLWGSVPILERAGAVKSKIESPSAAKRAPREVPA